MCVLWENSREVSSLASVGLHYCHCFFSHPLTCYWAKCWSSNITQACDLGEHGGRGGVRGLSQQSTQLTMAYPRGRSLMPSWPVWCTVLVSLTASHQIPHWLTSCMRPVAGKSIASCAATWGIPAFPMDPVVPTSSSQTLQTLFPLTQLYAMQGPKVSG